MPLPSYILLVKDYRKHVPGIHHLINLNNGAQGAQALICVSVVYFSVYLF